MSESNQDRDWKIEKINVYKKLIETKRLPKVADPNEPSVDAQILKEFTAWAEDQLARLLGESTPAAQGASGFSTEDTEILRGLIAQIKSRKGGSSQPTAPSAPISERPHPPGGGFPVPEGTSPKLTEEQIARLNGSNRPMKPIRAPSANSPQAKNNPQKALLDQLDEMDRSAPEF